MLYAFYWTDRTVTLCTDIEGRNIVVTQAVSGKPEARLIADEYSAKCWNF